MVDMVRFTVDVKQHECKEMFDLLISTGTKFLVEAYDAPELEEKNIKEPEENEQPRRE